MSLTVAAMPAYNVSRTISDVIMSCRKYVDKVVVIDDGSLDDTAKVARSLGAYVVRHSINLGYGAALKSCFNVARKFGADSLIIIDSDGQHNPDDIPRLLSPLKEGFDLVIGSRFVSGNGKNVPVYRRIGIKVLNFSTYVAGGLEVTDSQSGFRAYGKKAIEKIRFNGNDMSAGSEILIQAKEHKLKVTEVEIYCRYDLDNCSSQNAVVHGMKVLLSIILRTISKMFKFKRGWLYDFK